VNFHDRSTFTELDRDMETESDLLTPVQTAVRLGIEPHTLAVWRSSKRYHLTYVKVGRKVMYRKADVERFLKHRSRPGAPL
jgi:predicted site-specific integrase-resolvase